MGQEEHDLAHELNVETPELTATRRKLDQAERRIRELGDLEKRLAESKADRDKLQREFDLLAGFGQRSEPPEWLGRTQRGGSHRGQPWLFLSDLHLDEVVNADQVLGMNAYDRDIALARLSRITEGFITVTQDHWAGISYDGVVCPLGGDIFSGDIHDELKETNADTMLGSVDFWIDPLAEHYAALIDTFGSVHVPVVPGNHGRTTRKPRHKFRARSNFDWFIGAQLARVFRNEPRITFDVSESADALVPSYGRQVMVTHGDQVTGGGGIGGIWPPIMRLDARKSARQSAVDAPYDLLIMGHWHQLVFGPNFIVNGAMKGYDEFAFDMNFGFEVPQQAAWLMTPEHGKTWTAPIFCADRESEGW